LDAALNGLTPIFILVIGFAIKRLGVVDKGAADVLIKLAFNVFVPATIFYSLLELKLSMNLLILPLAGLLLCLVCFLISFLVKDLVSSDKKTQGAFILGSGMTNQAMFSYPFFLAYMGVTGLSYAAFYDFGQGALGFTLAYAIAAYFGNGKISAGRVARKVALFPFMWAFALGLAVNYLHLASFVEPVTPLLIALNQANMPIIMLALGLFIEPRIKNLKAMTGLLAIKFVAMPVLALLFVMLFNIQGLERTTIVIASAMPPAMMSLYYSVEEELDTEFCAAFLSAGIIIGMILTPILFSLLA
jgi:predicted permease